MVAFLTLIWLSLAARPAVAAGPTAAALGDALAELARVAVPAVVLVQVEDRAALCPELQELFQELGVVSAWRGEGVGVASGSGVIVSSDGRVLTNAHVVEGASGVTLVLSDQRRVAARVVGVDSRTDVAALQIVDEGRYPWLPLGDSSAVRVGDLVLAVGNPFEFQSSVTLGVISATGRRGLDPHEIQDYLQTDAAVNPGSSGGPLVDARGRVIGLNTAIFAPGAEQHAGISFAIPSNLARRVLEELDAQGRVPRGWVGLVTRSVAEVDGDPTMRGAEVLRVVPGSPAERAGVRRGDIIVSVGGEAVPSESALRTRVLLGEVGEPLSFTVTRDGRRVPLTLITAEERDVAVGMDALPSDTVFWQGLYLAAPSDALRARFGVGQGRGLLVVRLEPESAAARLGLKPGDLVLEVAGRPVREGDDLEGARSAARGEVLGLVLERSGTRAWAVLPR